MRFTLRAVALAAAVTAIAVPAVAASGSAKPVPNGNYCMNCTKKLAPGDFHVSKNGKSIDAWSYFNKCAPVPVAHPPKIAIKAGKFSFSGTLMEVTKTKLHYTLKGHFVTPHLAKGTVNATGGGKTCKAVSFKAKFVRTGPFQG
jgi:hypothetical protein